MSINKNRSEMDLNVFCHNLPKIELHAHLNGSLSRSTMLHLKRYYADSGLEDKTNAFFDEFQIGAGDCRNLSDCFQVFSIAHSLTSTPEALAMATTLTLQEFHNDGCCYIELRSTPRNTQYMTMKQYVDTIVHCIQKSSIHLSMLSRLILSINRSCSVSEAGVITDLAIESYKKFPDVIVGIELSGEPTVGKFQDFVPALTKAREAGLKITLHCGEVCNPEEILEMLKFKPERIGHGTCIHPMLGGTVDTWSTLCVSKIPVGFRMTGMNQCTDDLVTIQTAHSWAFCLAMSRSGLPYADDDFSDISEVCLTSNVNTKSTPDYDSHHFKYLYEAGVPMIICTDDKGVFTTSLSQEYRLCAETFTLNHSEVARLALDACQYIFAKDVNTVKNRVQEFINKHSLYQ